MIRRGLHIPRTTGGMRRVDGWLTQPAGEALETAMPHLHHHPQKMTIARRRSVAMTLWKTYVETGWTTGPHPPSAVRNHTSVSSPTSPPSKDKPEGHTKPWTETSSTSPHSARSPATAPSHASSSDQTQKSSTSDARPESGQLHNDGPSRSETVTAPPKPVAPEPDTVTSTTSITGPMVAILRSRTADSSADTTTHSSISKRNDDDPRGRSSPLPRSRSRHSDLVPFAPTHLDHQRPIITSEES
jgi:hypothetical protein